MFLLPHLQLTVHCALMRCFKIKTLKLLWEDFTLLGACQHEPQGMNFLTLIFFFSKENVRFSAFCLD